MKYAADFRQEARAALQGKWPLAILVGLVAAILGGATSGGPEFKINFTGGSLNANVQYAGQTIYSWGDGITPGLRAVLVGGAIYLILAAIVLGVLYFILGSVIEVGYARFNLNLTAGEKPPFETLFSYFPYWKTIAVTMLLQAVYILLWTLLLIIPGIMASYSGSFAGTLSGYPVWYRTGHSGGASGTDSRRGHRTVQGYDGGEPLAAVLPAIQLYRMGHPVCSDAGHRQSGPAALQTCCRSGVLPGAVRRYGARRRGILRISIVIP